MYHSQYGQDKIINEEIFKNKINGVFVEIGSHDGILLNNTYFFEKELGWRGVCIEPNPKVFQNLIKNRSAECHNVALLNCEGEVEYMALTGYTEMLSGIVNFYSDDFKTRIEQELSEHGGGKELIKIDCSTFNKIVEDKYLDIDYVSLDVEGAEEPILTSIDFSKYSIKVFTIENEQSQLAIMKFMKNMNYELFGRAGVDDIYVKKGTI